jgi:hypothetical protein
VPSLAGSAVWRKSYNPRTGFEPNVGILPQVGAEAKNIDGVSSRRKTRFTSQRKSRNQ